MFASEKPVYSSIEYASEMTGKRPRSTPRLRKEEKRVNQTALVC